MTQVYVGIGSNINRETSIRNGVKLLESLFEQLHVSPVYESEAYGFEGDDFLNLVVGFESDVDVEELEKHLKAIERQSGRNHFDSGYCARALDIDLLLYGDLISDEHELPRSDIVEYAFVLKPLCDIAPELIHPTENKSIQKLWQSFDDPNQQLNEYPNKFIR